MVLRALLCLVLLTACKTQKPGKWVAVDFGRPDSVIFELNFVSDGIGWMTTWNGEAKGTEGWEVFKTTDGGKSWSLWAKQAELKIKYTYFVTDKLGWALSLKNDILHTTDGGESWFVQRTAGKSKVRYKDRPSMEVIEPINQLYFVSPRVGWAWGGGKKEDSFEQEGIFLLTVDGGKTWHRQKYPFDHELQAIFFLDPDIGWASDRKAGLFRTVDGGSSWQKEPDDIRRPPITDIFFTDLMHGWIVGPDGYTAHTTDGGKKWLRVRLQKRSYLRSVAFIDSSNGWVAGEDSTICRTTDGGQTWSMEEVEVKQATITKLRILPSGAVWAAGNGVLLKLQAE
ncbi:MAG: YCF48-related protein [Acidobacteriota bacterium]|nr:YCF48-related protein [Blastocatellia bacterium]MDW8413694.1 YCF48-related protein [Acidobacteriota bacterium]